MQAQADEHDRVPALEGGRCEAQDVASHAEGTPDLVRQVVIWRANAVSRHVANEIGSQLRSTSLNAAHDPRAKDLNGYALLLAKLQPSLGLSYVCGTWLLGFAATLADTLADNKDPRD
ncbi:hypothetical protein NM688_g4201 [Phlebia brevispora]|uniref:Uncharacterized protein n=1 Tax=Phlebia brevispora TaxID=194682 RepID=A0ACC1T3B2_9APHY|nr:hypothetical protein NM688_g4201 [Phlebia brevispora]